MIAKGRQTHANELLHPTRCKGWSFTGGGVNPRLGQFLAGD